jgi:hypothetical protein
MGRMAIRKTKREADHVCDVLMNTNPYFFYKEVIFFNLEEPAPVDSTFLTFYEIFVRQVDIKLLEELSDENLHRSKACFFFKS